MCDLFCTQNKENKHKKTVERREKVKEKKQKYVEKAIPSIVDSIKTVVSLSKNEEFKTKCFRLFKAKDDEEFCQVLKNKLWTIASCKLNIKLNDKEKGQIVPEDGPFTYTTKKTGSVALSSAINIVHKGDVENYFDDLASEVSFYEGHASNQEEAHEKHRSGSIGLENELSFDILAELNWNEENPESGEMRRAEIISCSSSRQGTQLLIDFEQELQSSLQKKDKVLPHSTITVDLTSPKLQCHDMVFAAIQKRKQAPYEWHQKFTQDHFGFTSRETKGSEQSKTPSSTDQVKGRDIHLENNSIQCKTFSDDFDALGNFAFN